MKACITSLVESKKSFLQRCIGSVSVSIMCCAMSGCATGAGGANGVVDAQDARGSGVETDQDLSTEPARISFDSSAYQDVFSASREILREFRFAINRVDAARGVITTHPKRTVGFVSFWDQEQSSVSQEFEDFANQQERSVRVRFRQAEDSDSSALTTQSELSVVVLLYRVHRPHWRVESETLRLSSHASSRDAQGRREAREFREPIGQDRALAERIAQRIAEQFSQDQSGESSDVEPVTQADSMFGSP
jgi:hypothetical protein